MSMEFKGPPFLIDGHVHLHPCFDEARFFRAAAANFVAAGLALGLDEPPGGILMLTESSGTNRFADLCQRAERQEPSNLEIASTGEDRSLLVAIPPGDPMLVVAGRQLVTSESLEVLALGCISELPEGETLEATLDRVRDVGAIPVIPWGFGKWHSSRRRILLEVLQMQPPNSIFLGDNGGRASLLPQSALLRGGGPKGIRNLPGSDPLPFPKEETRAGSFGFVVEESLEPQQPATGLLRLLGEPGPTFQTYGSGLGAATFVRNQVAMQIRKRLGGAGR